MKTVHLLLSSVNSVKEFDTHVFSEKNIDKGKKTVYNVLCCEYAAVAE